MKLHLSKRWLRYGILAVAVLGIFVMLRPEDEVANARPGAGDPGHARSRNGTALPASTAEFLSRLAHRTSDDKDAGALFASRSWIQPPPPPPPPPPPAPPPPPTAPPLPFTLLGTFAAQGDEQTYFLSRGDRIYDVKMGATIDDDYELVAADAAALTFLYKPMKSRQTLALGGAQ